MARIFLCHANEDKPQVEELYDRLRELGFEPWMDKKDLIPGQRWQQEIPRALKSSALVLICLSQNIGGRGYVQREFKLTIDALQEIPDEVIHTIPVRLEPCTVPEPFTALHWCDLFESDGFDKLVGAIRYGLDQHAEPVSEADAEEPASPLEVVPESPENDTPPVSPPTVHQKSDPPVDQEPVVQPVEEPLPPPVAEHACRPEPPVVEEVQTQGRLWRNPAILAAIIGAVAVVAVVVAALIPIVLKQTSPPNTNTAVPEQTKPVSHSDTGDKKESPTPEQPKEISNSIGMKFVLIPAGEFMMGTSEAQLKVVAADSSERYRKHIKQETPQHRVVISRPFYMGRHEVTQEQWQAVMDENSSDFKGDGRRPVENVSWHEAKLFIDNLNKKEEKDQSAGKRVLCRLPTEAQWEYAARANSEGLFHFGDDDSALGAYAWYRENAGGKTQPVQQKKPNKWGLYDMHGNVAEWVQDSDGLYKAKSEVDPAGPKDYVGRNVIRGGDWRSGAWDLRAAYRDAARPSDRHNYLGFRCLSSGRESGSGAQGKP